MAHSTQKLSRILSAPIPRIYLNRAIALILIGGFTLYVYTVATVYFESMRRRPELYRMASMGNLLQIYNALGNYTDNHKGDFPDSIPTLYMAENHIFASHIFVNGIGPETPAVGPTTQAIADQLAAGGHLSIVYLGRGLGPKITTANTVVAYELLSAPNDGTTVLLGDGQVKYVEPAVIQKIISQANAGVFPVTMPSN
jgi:hypothetical protein